MPELPEVETARRGIRPRIEGRRIVRAIVRQPRLRWPVTDALRRVAPGLTVLSVGRRGKYLLLNTGRGAVIIHLGMSGSVRLTGPREPPGRHDHVDLAFEDGTVLRYTDPRRFGCVLWHEGDAAGHPLLRGLGVEPLDGAFDGEHLFAASRSRRSSVKFLIMDSRIVAGVGNIYAGEALFEAGILPLRSAWSISRRRYGRLADAVRGVLERALEAGGTTLRDFTGGDGRPGYFSRSLKAYGRAGRPCLNCGRTLRDLRLGGRSTVCCTRCQT